MNLIFESIIVGVLISICILLFFGIILFIDKTRKKLSWDEYLDKAAILSKQSRCEHKNWNCDTQIRVIECTECGKRACIKEYVNLF